METKEILKVQWKLFSAHKRAMWRRIMLMNAKIKTMLMPKLCAILIRVRFCTINLVIHRMINIIILVWSFHPLKIKTCFSGIAIHDIAKISKYDKYSYLVSELHDNCNIIIILITNYILRIFNFRGSSPWMLDASRWGVHGRWTCNGLHL